MQSIGQITQKIINPKWGFNPAKKTFSMPKWARLRMFIQYANGNTKYPSFDYHYAFNNGVKTKIKSELTGLQKLIELQHNGLKKGKTYRYINIFCNVSSNLDTVTGNFDYHVCTIVNGVITWKDPIFWRADNNQMMDIKRMIEYKQNKIN